MKVSSSSIYTQNHALPRVKFSPEVASQMTSFGGLVIFQQLFARLGLWRRLEGCTAHLRGSSGSGHLYSHGLCLRVILLHLLLGFKRLRDVDYYGADPLILRTLGLERMPSVPTLSRLLAGFDTRAIDRLQSCNAGLVLDRLEALRPATLTLDFDGSVLSTTRHAEGTAVGFNKTKKGARSYYPLFCTAAQTGQVLGVLHRSGNVHDSNGALEFIQKCVAQVRERLPRVRIEARLDGAFFSDAIVAKLEALKVQYTISVPFERFTELKGKIEARHYWFPVPGREDRGHFEQRWKPQSWDRRRRFIFMRTAQARQRKGPLQLDLFEPAEHDYQYKVIITNKAVRAGRAAAFHEGRGYQEKIFAELKNSVELGYIPCRRRVANEVWLHSALLAHNLGRELQLAAAPERKPATMSRTAAWMFESLETLRRTVIQRAAKLTRPQGKLTLTLPEIPALKTAITRYNIASL